MNLNELAVKVTLKEKGKKEISIAQIKEVIKLISIEMYLNPIIIARLIANGKKNDRKSSR